MREKEKTERAGYSRGIRYTPPTAAKLNQRYPTRVSPPPGFKARASIPGSLSPSCDLSASAQYILPLPLAAER